MNLWSLGEIEKDSRKKNFLYVDEIVNRAHEGGSECRASTWNFVQCPASTWKWDCQCRAEVERQVSRYQIWMSVSGDINFGLNVS